MLLAKGEVEAVSVVFERKNSYTIADLLEIMKLLRSEGGCPWDQEQTHESIRRDLIEETYEACEAIDQQDKAALQEELGDVLHQVVFHSQIEKEQGGFGFDNVCDGICKKLLERHPHVFAGCQVKDTQEVLTNWDAIKQKSKGQLTQSDAVKSVPKTFPALMRAQKVQKRAAKTGFNYPSVHGAMEDLESELKELRDAIKNQNQQGCNEELGDVLFSVVNVARLLSLDAEQSLTGAVEKFIRRFEVVEALAKQREISMESCGVTKLKALWEEAKGLTGPGTIAGPKL